MADALSREGIAVLRVDDRETEAVTLEGLARDVLAGVGYLKSRPEIDRKRIGLTGQSEGGLVGPKAASLSNELALLVLLATPGVNGTELAFERRIQSLIFTALESEVKRIACGGACDGSQYRGGSAAGGRVSQGDYGGDPVSSGEPSA